MSKRDTLFPTAAAIVAEMRKHTKASAGNLILLAELTADALGITPGDGLAPATVVEIALEHFGQ